jgi:integration host factor subunit beta
MTKADLITVIADKLKFPWVRAELLVDVVFGCMEQSMSRGEKIEIRGFGTFTVRQYRAYDGRSPRTGAVVPVKPKRLAFFKVSKEMRERVNGGRRSTERAAGAVGTSAIFPSPSRICKNVGNRDSANYIHLLLVASVP